MTVYRYNWIFYRRAEDLCPFFKCMLCGVTVYGLPFLDVRPPK